MTMTNSSLDITTPQIGNIVGNGPNSASHGTVAVVIDSSPHSDKNAVSPHVHDPHPKTSRISNVVNVAIDPVISSNPVLSAAIQVLEQISEVGKVLPIVAPVFALVKIIIDLEKRAADVDIKRLDLLERITFMGRHLPLLEKIQITDVTRATVDRMSDALRDCVELIKAYNKQGRFTRRLRLSNRDKFTACAEAINSCCRDLQMSLQIHQTVQIDHLIRASPVDPMDNMAQRFIDAQGGDAEAVIQNPELVQKFSEQPETVLDHTVMEQVSSEISNLSKEESSQSPDQKAGFVPFLRAYIGGAHNHFYTTDANEMKVATDKVGYTLEDTACNIYSFQSPDTVPLYRLYSFSGTDHFYTTSVAEASVAVKSHGYTLEGIAGYVFPENTSEGVVPLYRMYHGGGHDHFYTTSLSERQNAIDYCRYVDEGIAAYVFEHNK